MTEGYLKNMALGFASLALFACNESVNRPDGMESGRNGPDHSALASQAASGVVGVLSDGNWGYTSSDEIEVYMDTENDQNGDVLTSGGSDVNQLALTGVKRLPSPDHNGGMRFHFHATSLSLLPVLKYDYILPLFSDNCPANGIRFGEIFDNENTQNQDYASPSAYPGWSSRSLSGTRLEFCLVPGFSSLSDTIQPPWYGNSQGGFGLPGVSYYKNCGSSSKVQMDGENAGWAGAFDWEGMSANNQTRVKAIMDNQSGNPTLNINECQIP